MTPISDEYMQEMLATSRDYSVVILKAGPAINQPGARAIAREHGRRNFSLRAEGALPIVCRIIDDSDISGIGIFARTVEETRAIMDDDPGVKAGVFVYEIHPCSSFPGDSLPG